MKKSQIAVLVVLGSTLVLGLGIVLIGQDTESSVSTELTETHSPASLETDAATLTGVVQTYCQVCHNDQLLTGNLSLAGFEVENAPNMPETAEKMIRKLRAGMMPPPGMPRPSPETLMALVEELETNIDQNAERNPNPGVRRFQRLTRAEYEQSVLQLLDLEIDASRWLPEDTFLGNFNNLSAAQGLSTTLLESYLRAAAEVSRIALGNPDALSVSSKYTNPIHVSQHSWDHLEGTPFGTRGGMVVSHNFPTDGEYVISIETLFGRGVPAEDLDISIDGIGVAQLALAHNGDQSIPIQTKPVFVTAGQHQIAAAFVKRIEGPYEDRLSPFKWSFVGGEDAQQWANYGITALPHLADLMVTGPVTAGPVSETRSRSKIFSCYPSSEGEETDCAREIISRVATQAYRRAITEADLAGPMGFYDRYAQNSGFEIGVRTALQSVLASPSFLFRLEEQPEDVQPGQQFQLNASDLASRISFFIWGTGPDDELRELANQGRLSDPEVLEAQVVRMLSDPRSKNLATSFASQWLRLQEAGKNDPEPYLYPDFTGQLKEDMIRETQLFFENLIHEDRSLLEIVSADYTFVNERLADHYGIEGIIGNEFQRVTYTDENRRGLLGHGSVLMLTSMSNRTSPVLRGKWVMEVMLGSPPPPPPPDVPALEATEGAEVGRVLTTRERMEKHRANPTCNACHQFMDPIGLALDNFDVTGAWRIREDGRELDTSGTYYDGTDISTPLDLNEVLIKRPIPIVRSFTANLLAYAMGRRIEYFDQPTVRKIVEEAEAGDYSMSSFILGVVRSDPFQMMQVPTSVAATNEGV
jgi:cytochrome c5